MEKVEIEDWKLRRLEDRDRQYTRLEKELREKGLVYDSCAGCGRSYRDMPEVVLEEVRGRDCGCPAGGGFGVRTVSRKRTPQEIADWAAGQIKERQDAMPEVEEGRLDWFEGYVAAMKDLQALLATRHAKKYKCNTCHDEKVLHDTPTPGIETPCPDCT